MSLMKSPEPPRFPPPEPKSPAGVRPTTRASHSKHDYPENFHALYDRGFQTARGITPPTWPGVIVGANGVELTVTIVGADGALAQPFVVTTTV